MITIKTEMKIELKRGMVFRNPTTHAYYLLAQCTIDEYALIGLTSGNRWCQLQSMDDIETTIENSGFIYIGYLKDYMEFEEE